MRASARLVVVVGLAALTSGCITALTSIKLRPDGSGTIDQTLSMNAAAASQFAAMAKGLSDAAADGTAAPAAEPDFFSEKEMKEAATKYGEGVTFVSSTPIKTADRVGRVATYQFADITKLKIDQKPQTGDMPGASASGGADDVLFRFTKLPAGTSQLTVVFPEAKFDEARKEAAAQKKEGAADPAQIEMMKKLLDGLKVGIDVSVLGTIVKTNSPYVQGSTVTLLEMDFAQLLSNEQLMSEFGEPGSLEEAKALLKNVKGFKINLDREVAIEFK
jgi:hypothetical protein